ncbi:MAG: methyltransferase [Candidatus Heimdallarchaeota archaeon]|nr:methyltransferase [Candidatus Heimdallarchaeota archaeon]
MNIRENFQLKSNPEVYSPNEDSWFLAETIKYYFLKETPVRHYTKRWSVCEVGVGTGYISIYLAKNVPNLRIFGTDISPCAVSLGLENMRKWIPKIEFNLYCANLMNCFDTNNFKPEVIYFNPPYVRTPLDEVRANNSLIQRSWAGGPDGITIIQGFIKELEMFNFKKAFFLSSSLNSNEKFLKHTSSTLVISELSKKKIADEHLICYSVTPTCLN